MKDEYMQCYLAGRYELAEGDNVEQLDELAERVMVGGAAHVSVREVSFGAAKKAIDAEMDPAVKMQWLKDNLEEIKAMGGDAERAYRLYVQGRVDNLAHQLEADIITTIEESLEEEDDEGDEDDDDEESADDDGDEEDED